MYGSSYQIETPSTNEIIRKKKTTKRFRDEAKYDETDLTLIATHNTDPCFYIGSNNYKIVANFKLQLKWMFVFRER